jgi:hypothetical protein
MPRGYAIGLDFGTNSVRAVVIDVADGRQLSSAMWSYSRGTAGVMLEPTSPDLARQHPADYLAGIEVTVRQALEHEAADAGAGFSPRHVIGIGVDTTGSTPLPLDANGVALALLPKYAENPDAMAWLWKDHTAHAEAEEITALAKKKRPAYLAKCGGGIRRNGSGRSCCGASASRRRCSRRRTRGWSWRTGCRRCSPGPPGRIRCAAAFARRGTRRSSTPRGAVIPTSNFYPR